MTSLISPLFLLGALLTVLAAPPLRAQGQSQDVVDSERVAASVTVVLAGSLPPGAGALIQRYAGQPAQNMIVLSDDAGPAQLHAALAILRSSRQTLGDSLSWDVRMTIPAVTVAVRDTVERRNIQRQLDRLRTARADVDRTGGRRSITLPLGPIAPR